MVERFLTQTTFTSQEDFIKNLHIRVPENFNFGYRKTSTSAMTS